MKRLAVCLLLWALPLLAARAQSINFHIDSLKHLLAHTQPDTSRVLLLAQVAIGYYNYSSDSGMLFARQALQLARKSSFTKGEGRALGAISGVLRVRGELPQALAYAFRSLAIARVFDNPREEAAMLNAIGIIYQDLGESQQALNYYRQSRTTFESIPDKGGTVRAGQNITGAYISLNLLDSARLNHEQVSRLTQQLPASSTTGKAVTLQYSGRVEALSGNPREALNFYRQALRLTYLDNNFRIRSGIQLNMAELFNQMHQPDSSLRYAHLALMNSQQQEFRKNILQVSNLLIQLYKSKNNLDSAFKYQETARAANDSLYGQKKFHQLQRFTLAEQQRQQAVIDDQKEYQNRIRFYTLLAGLGGLLLLAYVLWRNNRQKHKANTVLEKTLTELKATQTQLIQREKMASLGELTAGIAHEIQNPLNFVNNFSEVSSELVTELKAELDRGDTQEAKAIADDLTQNLQKIHHHGGRASAIVKGMLEHSRSSTGERQPTDLNALADEYLRLAYQGMRAKNKDFECRLETHFEPALPLVSVVGQDMSRVLLNLFNNAFYAVGQKQKIAPADYQPTVTVSTAHTKGAVEIRVRDNGGGIPDSVKAKIFQPFFTTKPTGEGTGLGLSLSYDIVTKGHGGTLEVESAEGQFTEFVITLPIAKPA